MGGTTLVIGIDPGVPRAKAAAAFTVLTLDPAGTIGALGRSRSMRKPELAELLRNDPLLTDQRLRLAAIGAPLTPVRLERRPWRARQVEIRLSRGAFAGSLRGPQPPWISAVRSGWPRYQEGAAVLDVLHERGFPLFPMPPEGVTPELPSRCSVEVYPKAALTVLLPREAVEDRPLASELMGQVDDWLFPQIFLPPPGSPAGSRAPIEDILQDLAPGLRCAPEMLAEAARIAAVRRPFSRREPMRSFVAALQGVLALEGAAALVGTEGDSEGYFLLPAVWHPDWEEAWRDPRHQDLPVRRVGIPSS